MPKTLSDLQLAATELGCLLGGLDVIQDMRGGLLPEGADIQTRRAFEAMPAMIEDAIRRAEELAADLEDLEAAERGAKRAALVGGQAHG